MQNNKVAVFIDAENISAKYSSDILKFAESYGNVIIKRIYGDFSLESIQKWKEEIFTHSIKTMHQFHISSIKNSSDILLAVDVLSFLYEKDIDVFVLASSDCDYCSLVTKLIESNKTVIGIGESKTPKAYANLFSKFNFLDNLDSKDANKTSKKNSPFILAAKNQPQISKDQLKALTQIVEELIAKNSLASYVNINNQMRKRYPDFKAKTQGFTSFKALMRYFVSLNDKYTQISLQDNSTCLIKKPKNLRPN